MEVDCSARTLLILSLITTERYHSFQIGSPETLEANSVRMVVMVEFLTLCQVGWWLCGCRLIDSICLRSIAWVSVGVQASQLV